MRSVRSSSSAPTTQRDSGPTTYDDATLRTLVTDLGGHDIGLLLDTFAECDRHPDQPSVVFAYTIKGWGLPIAGDPLNHAALLTPEQIATFRATVGLSEANEWERFAADSDAGRMCASVGGAINNPLPVPRPRPYRARVGTAGRRERHGLDPGGVRAGARQPRRRPAAWGSGS